MSLSPGRGCRRQKNGTDVGRTIFCLAKELESHCRARKRAPPLIPRLAKSKPPHLSFDRLEIVRIALAVGVIDSLLAFYIHCNPLKSLRRTHIGGKWRDERERACFPADRRVPSNDFRGSSSFRNSARTLTLSYCFPCRRRCTKRLVLQSTPLLRYTVTT